MKCSDKLSIVVLAIFSMIVLFGCNRMMTARHDQLVKDADGKASQGDFLRAISLYEAALDDSPHCAEVHYKLALLYDDKMNEPLNALHHFKRYLVLSPGGPHANDVRNLMKRDEISLVTSFSGDSVMTRIEAARLKNENLDLRKQLEERSIARGVTDKSTPKTATPVAPSSKKSGAQSYVVKQGDTLASISRKFYRTSARWKKILDANKKNIQDPEKLKIGQSLVIP